MGEEDAETGRSHKDEGAERESGEQVEGGKAASAEMGSGGRLEWNFVQVDRISKTKREGG